MAQNLLKNLEPVHLYFLGKKLIETISHRVKSPSVSKERFSALFQTIFIITIRRRQDQAIHAPHKSQFLID